MLPVVRFGVGQVAQIVPQIAGNLNTEPYGRAAQAVLSHSRIAPIRRAMRHVYAGRFSDASIEVARRADPNNGLWVVIDLLAALEARSPNEETIRDRLHGLRHAPPMRLYLAEQHRLLFRAFRDAGVPPRRAAVAAQRIRVYMRQLVSREAETLRRLARRLDARARRWAEAGDETGARDARLAIIHIMTQAVRESPTPLIGLAASEWVARAARDLSEEADGDGTIQAAVQAASFRDDWHALVQSHGVNVLPYTGLTLHASLARRSQERALRGILSVMLLEGVALSLVAVVLVAGVMTLVTRLPADGEVRFQPAGPWWFEPGILVAGAYVLGPLLAMLAVIGIVRIDAPWLISLPSLYAVIGWPALVVVLLGIGIKRHRDGVGSVSGASDTRRGAALSLAVLIAAGGLAGGLCLWRGGLDLVPWGVRCFRTGGIMAGGAGVVVLGVWIADALYRALGRRFAWSVWSRSYLTAASMALTVVIMLLGAAGVLNARWDRQHQVAFAQGMADPLGDLLGEDWYETYFALADALLADRDGQ